MYCLAHDLLMPISAPQLIPMKTRIQIILVSLFAVLLSSCASGPDYASTKAAGALTPSPGNGMVLIYRTAGFVSAAYKPYIYANGALLPARLQRGGFYSLEAAPGPLLLAYSKEKGESTAATKTNAVIQGIVFGGVVGGALAPMADVESRRRVGLPIQVLPGQTHYVTMGGAGGDLSVADRIEAEEEIIDCKWLNPK